MTAGFIHGIHAVRTHLFREHQSSSCLMLRSGNRGPRLREIEKQARKLGCQIDYLDKAQLDKVTPNHQGVILQVASRALKEKSLDNLIDEPGNNKLFLILDGVTDPRNLGACIRSAATLGVTAVLAPKSNSAPLSAVASKTASGGANIVPYVQVTNLSRAINLLKEAGFWIVGTVLESSTALARLDLTGNIVLVLGSEDKGLRRITKDSCDFLATIPMVENSLGFNVSVAAGICLYEIQRQRELATGDAIL